MNWQDAAAVLRALYELEQDGFSHRTYTTEPVTVYPGDKNNLPYDVVVERLHIEEPEPPAPEPEKTLDEVLDEHPISIQVNGEWQTFPNAAAAEDAAYEEYKTNVRRNAQNFHITDDHLGEGGPKVKFQANINAIQLLKELEATGQQASPEQQQVLSRYVGWGGLPDAFEPSKESWSKEYAQLKELLTPEEYAAARGSTLNAHYTSPTVIQAIYEAVGRMGFETGNILEPSCGVGNFFGMLPERMAGSKLYGVELDPITGRIAEQLYPKANITVAGFETTDHRDFYDLAVGNVPFGQYQVNDKAYNKLGFNIHNYFFAKSLDQVRPGGVVAFVTSRYTMDAKDSTVRRYLAQRAELLGAIRLPNNAFKANAGTEVVSDIIFLQKRDRPLDITPEWTQTGQTEDGFAINRYFLDHPEMVLGRQEPETTTYSHTAAYASEHGELEQYRASNQANLQCKEAIEAAVREHFDGMYLNQDAAKGVIQTYGLDRVMLVLANTVQLQDWDGRYSHRNKEWAKTIPNYNSDTVRRGYALNSHPAVLDGFIDLVREEQQRSHTKGEKAQQPRTSVRDKLKQEPPAHKPVTQKKREQER